LLAVKTGVWTCSVVALQVELCGERAVYIDSSDATHGARNPIQLTDVPVKVSVAGRSRRPVERGGPHRSTLDSCSM